MRLVSRSMMAYVAIAVAVASLVAGCANSASEPVTPTVPRAFGPVRFDSLYVSYEGERYRSEWGALREDLVNLSALSPLDSPVMTYSSPGAGPRTVIAERAFEIEGVSGREFIVGRVTVESDIVPHSDFIPSCGRRSEAHIFTAIGVDQYPPPFSYPTRTPSSDGRPTPTPAPTPTYFASVSIDLTSQGLLDGGWPRSNWEEPVLTFEGKEYRHTSSRYLDFNPFETSLPSSELAFVELVQIMYEPQPELHEILASIYQPATVTDYVQVLRPVNEAFRDGVIVVVPCPKYYPVAEYVIYRKIVAEG